MEDSGRFSVDDLDKSTTSLGSCSPSSYVTITSGAVLKPSLVLPVNQGHQGHQGNQGPRARSSSCSGTTRDVGPAPLSLPALPRWVHGQKK